MTTHPHLQTLSGMPNTLGRFEIKQVLGRGAQAGVWLAHDPRLQRDVALKVLHTPRHGHAPADAAHWLKEARNLSQLVHPHIVTLYEADVWDGRPGMALEVVTGPSLARRLAQTGALPALEAVRLMNQVLDALQHAHQQGVVHRDLKPSNILLDANGSAKVSDFGMASRLPRAAQPGEAAAHPGGVEGTPNYLSPEAARGLPPSPTNDVFAAGLVLAEMLLGRPLMAETDPYRAVYRLAHEDLVLPHDPQHPLDDALRALVQRALARDPALRWPSAGAMAEALRDWAAAQQGSPGDALDASGKATLDFLLRRMRRTSDFPAMSAQIVRVQSLASSENESLNSLTSEILKDVALTNKLLRIVNSAHFSHVGGGHINTVSRAVSLIGFAGIRNVAMSLVLLDHMENKAHAEQLKAEFARALLAGGLASDLGAGMRDTEEIFIGAMLHNLGRLLTEFYFPDEARQIRQALAAAAGAGAAGDATANHPVRRHQREEQAAQAVLGIGFEALAEGVGKSWGLPDSMLRLMRHSAAPPPSRPVTDAPARQQLIAQAANAMADVFLNAEEATLHTQLHQVASVYAAALSKTSTDIEAAVAQARDKLAITAESIGLYAPAHSRAARLLRRQLQVTAPTAADSRHPPPGQPVDSPISELHATTHHALNGAVDGTPATASEDSQADATSSLLATGIQDITNAMVDSFKLNDVLRMVLETMYRAMGFRQVVFCLRDGNSGAIQGRLGLGEDATNTARVFRVVLSEPNNLFAAVCNKGVDTLIHDATADKVRHALPGWYHQHVHARSFMLLPLHLKGAPLGLIYADQAQADAIVLDEKGLSLLKTLRNQAVMAFKHTVSNR